MRSLIASARRLQANWSAWQRKPTPVQKEVWALLETAYDAMEKARLVMGSDHVEWAALAVNKTVDVHLKLRGIMGVAIPQIKAQRRASETAL